MQRLALCGAAIALAACVARRAGPDDVTVLPEWRAALRDAHTVRLGPVPHELPKQGLDPALTLVVVDPNWREPTSSLDEPRAQALLQFVQQGGRLVLFGHAARWVAALGVEPEVPENTVYRWGFDHRALRGEAELSLTLVSGKHAALFEGLTARHGEFSFPITGGIGCTLPLCAWRLGAPQKGEVVARLGAVEDGQPKASDAPVLLRYAVGRGQVLACGLLPELGCADEVVRANARAFVACCAASVGGAAAPVQVWSVAERSAPADAPALPADGPPIVPLLAHWGWQVGLYDGEEPDAVRPRDELLRDALHPSWVAGADLVEFELTDARHGVPLPWNKDDAIERPGSFRGDAVDASFGSSGLRALADEAHARGLLSLLGLDPLPVGDRPTERLVALRWLARELLSVRRLGAGAFDGIGLRQWWSDGRGYGRLMVQDYQPAAVLYCGGEQAPPMAGALRALDADDGAPRGLSLAGVAAGWRDGFAADRFPIGVLDARHGADRSLGNGVRGGGCHADWLVAQWNTFVRARRLQGGAALWRRHDPRTLGPDTVAYVHGLGSEPLVAAVAMPLAATGQDGVRAAAAELLDERPAGFGATVAAPAAVHALQNNWFRLLGSGGALAYDPRGLARFGDAAVALSPSLLRTRLFGGRPDVAALSNERVDFLERGYRGEGGYGDAVRVGNGPGCDPQPPALLGFGDAPTWPQRAAFEWAPSAGYHELELDLRSERGSSLVALRLDDVLLRAIAVSDRGRSVALTVPVHIARSGTRLLSLEVLDGSLVAIDRLRTSRAGDVGVEAEVTIPAGSVAQLIERSLSSYHQEEVALTAMADQPGFVIETRCERAARNLQLERRLQLPDYALVSGSDGDDPAARRAPFVLGCDDVRAPDVLIVPLQLSRYEHFVLGKGEVVWRAQPESGLRARVGVLLAPHGRGAALLPHAARIVDGIDRPEPLQLGGVGRATLVTDMPLPWNRLLLVDRDADTPFMVRERGLWTWRGSTPAPRGGSVLRVWQEPGDTIEVVAGPAVVARTHPGPGSLRVMALEEPQPREVTVHVLQPSRLSAPCVVMGDDFQEVEVNGQPWSCFDGRTVFLPDRPGRYRVEVKAHGGPPAPHVLRSGAALERCSYDPTRRELVLVAAAQPGRPVELPNTAVLSGPVPREVENGEVVAAKELQLGDVAAEAAAERGGVLIRFKNGITTVRY
ncbi:MAG: hypothetical protein H6835_13865 [Planctomycetes bacterium]|nr:hypothetical protein [Planctomycetota bacterium]